MGVAMSGEMNLETILRNLQPVLLDASYVFCSLPNKQYGDLDSLSPLASIQEPEGLTLVLQVQEAKDQALRFHGEFRCIRLQVHSSLESVGLTAAISTALAHEGISANLLAGTHHDHVLVPVQRALDAMETLQALSPNQD